MIHEIATLSIDPSRAAAFEAAAAKAKPIFLAADDCHDMRVERVIEVPGRYLLIVRWSSVAAHEAFRATPAFQDWRALAGPFFAEPPVVVHAEQVV